MTPPQNKQDPPKDKPSRLNLMEHLKQIGEAFKMNDEAFQMRKTTLENHVKQCMGNNTQGVKHAPVQALSATEEKTKIVSKMLNTLLSKAAKNRMVSTELAKDIIINGLKANTTQANKYTIVEITVKGRRFHGLAARHDTDEANELEGIGRAINRAVNQLLVWDKFGDMKDICIRDNGKRYSITKEELEALLSRNG